MKLEEHLFSLEEKFWTEGTDYYARHLASAALMVFPEPTGVLVKDDIASSVQGGQWSEVSLEEHRVLELTDRSALVTYKATAIRNKSGDKSEPYVVRASSAYVRDGNAWRLAFHQQTPIAVSDRSPPARRAR